jgi:hypothetical protein
MANYGGAGVGGLPGFWSRLGNAIGEVFSGVRTKAASMAGAAETAFDWVASKAAAAAPTLGVVTTFITVTLWTTPTGGCNDDLTDRRITETTGSAGRSDPHGREAGEVLKNALQNAKDALEQLVRNQGSKAEKTRLEKLIKNLKKKIDQMPKGETHWRRGK